ncbi:hypothetical protein ACFQ5N_02270 [Lutibacter holmesii]|uniref:Uncharacterized protein n=1 Tax=Lutibacter holmesii TaxID=1137985 RepID=A0ABW3WKP6_9FLAO
MQIEKEQEEQIVNFGAFQYNNLKMANILNVTEKEVEIEMENKNSLLYNLYLKGKDRADYVIDLKLFEMAKSGDIKALNKFENRIFLRK